MPLANLRSRHLKRGYRYDGEGENEQSANNNRLPKGIQKSLD